jgi:hypothetical protein
MEHFDEERGMQIVTQPIGTTAASTAHTLPIDALTNTASRTISQVRWRGVRWIRPLVVINFLLVALQPISAGLFLSGYGRATTVHAAVALALLIGVLIQGVSAVVLWRRGAIPGWVAAVSVGLFLMVLAQYGLGHNKVFWLHVPIGVGLFGWLIRLRISLDSL